MLTATADFSAQTAPAPKGAEQATNARADLAAIQTSNARHSDALLTMIAVHSRAALERYALQEHARMQARTATKQMLTAAAAAHPAVTAQIA